MIKNKLSEKLFLCSPVLKQNIGLDKFHQHLKTKENARKWIGLWQPFSQVTHSRFYFVIAQNDPNISAQGEQGWSIAMRRIRFVADNTYFPVFTLVLKAFIYLCFTSFCSVLMISYPDVET